MERKPGSLSSLLLLSFAGRVLREGFRLLPGDAQYKGGWKGVIVRVHLRTETPEEMKGKKE